MRQNTFAVVTATLLLTACSVTSKTLPPIASEPSQSPKNIIMVVSDGMGPAYTTAYRNFRDNVDTPLVESVIFDDIFVGNASTYPARVSGYVTDSAAAATALASGVKSYNGAVGVDVDKQPVTSVLQKAKSAGMKTGIAVTSQIVHATPAAYMAHNESRQNYNALADSYYDDKINGKFIANVMLGGGTDYFKRDDRDITTEFINAGYRYVETYEALTSLSPGEDVLGLFAPIGLPWALDDTLPHRLAFLAQQAVKQLENDRGYFLLIEASQVDWAGHANDIASAMAEMDDLNATLVYLYEYVQSHPDTLVIVTADHSTGGLTVGANDQYLWSPEWLKTVNASPATIAVGSLTADNPIEYIQNRLGFTLSQEETEHLLPKVKSKNAQFIESSIKSLLDMRTNTGWTTNAHTGVDVEVFAFGQGHQLFRGQYDNTDIAKKIASLLPKAE